MHVLIYSPLALWICEVSFQGVALWSKESMAERVAKGKGKEERKGNLQSTSRHL
jgi:hypothetical protein